MPHKTPEARRAFNARWREKNRDSLREYKANYRVKRRLSALKKLGGKCVRCGNDDPRVLQIDHINGGGRLDRDTKSGWGYTIETQILHESRDDLQLLCANCHMIKTWGESWKRLDLE